MATMGPWSRVRMVKCQMLVTSFFVLLLGLSMATLAALTYYGAHFAVIGHASSDKTPYEAMHRWTSRGPPTPGVPSSWTLMQANLPPLCPHSAFYAGISLAGLLTVGAVLGAAATMREAGGLMAGGFLCFALVFGALVEVAFWRFHNPTQVEDAVLDTYDLVYDQAVKNVSGTPQQQLVAIQDTVYAMLLSSFLWFAIRSGCSLDRKGKYTLSRRAPDCQPQEPSFFRHSPGWPVLQHPTEVDVPHGHLGASSPSGGPQLLQDS
ncbi:tetraspanin-32 isoform X5 [Canis lupus familiaris]|uniref:tetraspanin-32 isoform X5 n=1 Tax=Canis lupus familiaris TaxID=9615 RepID=UPI0015F153A3|nr:tetraspanin-32 isoform X5 [Canis lupus familiaris]XP_038309963.1 tetraspanin-32 isoform X5 [Canis lupus familiaris]XP_038418424.1 tetraspanin-32 isoform X5 [Canis lupus familiaris]